MPHTRPPSTGRPQVFPLLCATVLLIAILALAIRIATLEPAQASDRAASTGDITAPAISTPTITSPTTAPAASSENLSAPAFRPGDAKLGRKLYRALACNTCHTTDGSILQGPSFLNVYGTITHFPDGGEAEVNDEYIRNSILQPKKQVVAGFAGIMPEFAGRVSEQDIQDLIAFIKAQKDTP